MTVVSMAYTSTQLRASAYIGLRAIRFLLSLAFIKGADRMGYESFWAC